MKKQVKQVKNAKTVAAHAGAFKNKIQKVFSKKSNVLIGAGIVGGAGAIALAVLFVPWKKVADTLEYNILRIEEEFNALVEENPVEQSGI
jgi:hypothetical protein